MIRAKNGDTVEIAGSYQYRALYQANPIQRFWHYAKILTIKKYLPPERTDSILDVGCGSGVIADFLGDFAAHVVGIDINPASIEFASRTFGRENVVFHRQLVDAPMPVPQPVDKIYCLELIEHIHEPQAEKMLGEFRSVLKPGGKVFLTTPNYHSLWPVIEWAMDRSGRFPTMADDQHVAFYHRRKLAALCTAGGFDVEVLASINFVAPWLAPLSWALAERLFAWESRSPFTPGSILVCVLQRKGM